MGEICRPHRSVSRLHLGLPPRSRHLARRREDLLYFCLVTPRRGYSRSRDLALAAASKADVAAAWRQGIQSSTRSVLLSPCLLRPDRAASTFFDDEW